MTKIIQLTTPLDRFKGFDRKLDLVLSTLDECGVLYTDLGFREADVEDLTREQVSEFRDELKEHAQMIMSLLHHPLIQVLKEKRDTAEVNDATTAQFQIPTGHWQHYKGAIYNILGPCRLTDSRLDGITYQLASDPTSTVYAISLINFYRQIKLDGRQIKRFVKVA